MIKNILFDMDGVLLETEGFHFAAWEKAFGTVGIRITERDYIEKIQSRARAKAILAVTGRTDEDWTLELSGLKEKYYLEMLDRRPLPVFQDAVGFVERMYLQGIRMGVASSSVLAKELLERSPFGRFMEGVVSGKDVLENKPNPEIYLKAAKLLGAKREDTVIFEDSDNGILAGIYSGFMTVGIRRGLELHVEPFVVRECFDGVTLETLNGYLEVFLKG